MKNFILIRLSFHVVIVLRWELASLVCTGDTRTLVLGEEGAVPVLTGSLQMVINETYVSSLLSATCLRAEDHATIPPRGWNSYDSYGWIISEEDFMANVELVAQRLKNSGYEVKLHTYSANLRPKLTRFLSFSTNFFVLWNCSTWWWTTFGTESVSRVSRSTLRGMTILISGGGWSRIPIDGLLVGTEKGSPTSPGKSTIWAWSSEYT